MVFIFPPNFNFSYFLGWKKLYSCHSFYLLIFFYPSEYSATFFYYIIISTCYSWSFLLLLSTFAANKSFAGWQKSHCKHWKTNNVFFGSREGETFLLSISSSSLLAIVCTPWVYLECNIYSNFCDKIILCDSSKINRRRLEQKFFIHLFDKESRSLSLILKFCFEMIVFQIANLPINLLKMLTKLC